MKPDQTPTIPEAPYAVGGAIAPNRRRRTKRAAVATGVAVASIAIIGLVAFTRIGGGLDEGRRLAKQQRWGESESVLARYLRLWPDDAEARLLIAEVVVKRSDETGRGSEAAAAALNHLDRISDESPWGPEARLRAARLLLFVEKKPHAAESQLRRALAGDRDLAEAHSLLWRVLDLTRRSERAEPAFSEVMRLAPEKERIAHLRQWYLSQFAPASANLKLDWLLGVLPPGGVPGDETDLSRYQVFRASEPGSPIHVASIARYLLKNGEPQRAADLLDGFDGKAGRHDPFFLATRAEAAHDLGDTETFDRVIRQWPEPREGYEFHKWDGIRLEETEGDAAAAAESYRSAMATWPGPLDWQLMFRLSNCLTRLGRTAEAERARVRSAEIERLMVDEVHRPIRHALGDMSDPVGIERLADFYEAIDRRLEAALWLRYVEDLRRRPSDAPEPTITGVTTPDPFRGASGRQIPPFRPSTDPVALNPLP